MTLLTSARSVGLKALLGFTLGVNIVLVFASLASAQEHSMGAMKPATIMTGLGDLHHPVSTKNAQAQAFFDQGLRLIYAFQP